MVFMSNEKVFISMGLGISIKNDRKDKDSACLRSASSSDILQDSYYPKKGDNNEYFIAGEENPQFEATTLEIYGVKL